MTARPFVRRALSALALLAIVTAPAAAQQGKGKKGSASAHASKPAVKPAAKPAAKHSVKPAPKAKPAGGKEKHKVTHAEAVDVSRRVLIEQGYSISRVERRGDTQVIYYYRGNNGRGKGRGPLERIVVRPKADRFVFEGAPSSVLKAVTLRLQM
jgi:hypothetical protein